MSQASDWPEEIKFLMGGIDATLLDQIDSRARHVREGATAEQTILLCNAIEALALLHWRQRRKIHTNSRSDLEGPGPGWHSTGPTTSVWRGRDR